MPMIHIRSLPAIAWPTLCVLPDGVPDAYGRLPPMSYSFKNRRSKQEFTVQLSSYRIAAEMGEGIVRVRAFEVTMS